MGVVSLLLAALVASAVTAAMRGNAPYALTVTWALIAMAVNQFSRATPASSTTFGAVAVGMKLLGGNARRASGDLAGAMNDYDQALILDPRYALAFLNRGIGHLQQGHKAEAKRDFDQCLKIDPTMKSQLEAVVGEARRRLGGKLEMR